MPLLLEQPVRPAKAKMLHLLRGDARFTLREGLPSQWFVAADPSAAGPPLSAAASSSPVERYAGAGAVGAGEAGGVARAPEEAEAYRSQLFAYLRERGF